MYICSIMLRNVLGFKCTYFGLLINNVLLFQKVEDVGCQLTSWTQTVTRLRSQYEWLLFFSVPKLLLVYQLMQGWNEEEEEGCLDQLVREIMFLITNDPLTRDTLRKNIEVILTNNTSVFG